MWQGTCWRNTESEGELVGWWWDAAALRNRIVKRLTKVAFGGKLKWSKGVSHGISGGRIGGTSILPSGRDKQAPQRAAGIGAAFLPGSMEIEVGRSLWHNKCFVSLAFLLNSIQ